MYFTDTTNIAVTSGLSAPVKTEVTIATKPANLVTVAIPQAGAQVKPTAPPKPPEPDRKNPAFRNIMIAGALVTVLNFIRGK